MEAPPVPDLQGRDLDPGVDLARLRSDLQALIRAAREIETHYKRVSELRTLLGFLPLIEQFARELGILVADIHGRAAELMGDQKKIDLGGEIGIVERYTTSTNKWDNDGLFVELAKRVPVAVDPSTGEATIDGMKFAAVLKSAAAVSYWRKGALSKMGVDADQYVEKSWGRRKVRVQKREDASALRSAAGEGSSSSKA